MKTPTEKSRVGREGEDLACFYLEGLHYQVLERNFRTRFGEIDIIAREKKALIFIEVKTRRSQSYGLPAEGVGRKKCQNLSRAAQYYITKHHLEDNEARFDLVAIRFSEKGPIFELIKNAFEFSI